jgi:hypothetical protein
LFFGAFRFRVPRQYIKNALPLNFITMSGIARMVTRASTARRRTASDSTARETGEPSSQQIKQEAATASETGPATRPESEITREDLLNMITQRRKLVEQLLEHQTRPQTTELAVRTPTKAFRMKNLAPLCGGADNLDGFLTQLELLFKSNDQYFVRSALNKVQYASSLLGSGKENVDESLRKTYMTHPNQWASELVKSK